MPDEGRPDRQGRRARIANGGCKEVATSGTAPFGTILPSRHPPSRLTTFDSARCESARGHGRLAATIDAMITTGGAIDGVFGGMTAGTIGETDGGGGTIGGMEAGGEARSYAGGLERSARELRAVPLLELTG